MYPLLVWDGVRGDFRSYLFLSLVLASSLIFRTTFCCHSEEASNHRAQANLNERLSKLRIRTGVEDLKETLGLQDVKISMVSEREESIPVSKMSCKVFFIIPGAEAPGMLCVSDFSWVVVVVVERETLVTSIDIKLKSWVIMQNNYLDRASLLRVLSLTQWLSDSILKCSSALGAKKRTVDPEDWFMQACKDKDLGAWTMGSRDWCLAIEKLKLCVCWSACRGSTRSF